MKEMTKMHERRVKEGLALYGWRSGYRLYSIRVEIVVPEPIQR